MPRSAGLYLSIAAFVAACSSSSTSPDPDKASGTATATSRAGSTSAHVEWVHVPVGMDPTSFVKSELDRAKQDKKRLLVYVGATWCEPCQRFHKAAEAGELDTVFPDLRFVDLDNDADASIITELGCGSKMIPLFAIPDASGHCTERRVEGGIKGDGAVGYISPRLRAMVGPVE